MIYDLSELIISITFKARCVWFENLQLQPGRRLASHSIRYGPFQPFIAVCGIAHWSGANETLQVLARQEDKKRENKKNHSVIVWFIIMMKLFYST